MANKVVQLVDKNSNNLYPIAGSVITDAVSTTAISNQAVTNPKIENGAVNGVANDATAIGTAKLALDTVGTPNLRNESVTSNKIDWPTLGNKHTYEDNGGTVLNYYRGILGITCDVAGTYLVIGSFSGYGANSGAYVQAKIDVGGVAYGETTTGTSDGRAQVTIVSQLTLNAGDKVDLYGLCSAGTLNLSGRHNTLSMIRIG